MKSDVKLSRKHIVFLKKLNDKASLNSTMLGDEVFISCLLRSVFAQPHIAKGSLQTFSATNINFIRGKLIHSSEGIIDYYFDFFLFIYDFRYFQHSC